MHQGGQELGLSGTVNTCESLINAVIENKPKMLTGLDQKGRWSSSDVPNSSDADVAPPAERRDLTHSGTHTKHGKPVALPTRERLSDEKANLKAGPAHCAHRRAEQA